MWQIDTMASAFTQPIIAANSPHKPILTSSHHDEIDESGNKILGNLSNVYEPKENIKASMLA